METWPICELWSTRVNRKVYNQFAIFKPPSYRFKETREFDVKAAFESRPLLRLIRWCNKRGDITTECWEKAIQFCATFHGLKITNCNWGFFFFCKRCIITYCTSISTEQIEKLKSSPKISYLMYFNIPSDQPKISRNTVQ